MNENGGIYGGCFDCEDCKEQNLYCEDCSMYEYDKYRLGNQANNSMNKRQKKKFIKKNMTKLRKIHPSEGDIVVLQWNPDSEYIDFDTIVEFYKAWENVGIFDKCGAAIVPCDFKIFNKEDAQIYINKLQSIVDQMG